MSNRLSRPRTDVLILAVTALALCLVSAGFAATGAAKDAPTFSEDIAPLFYQHCVKLSSPW